MIDSLLYAVQVIMTFFNVFQMHPQYITARTSANLNNLHAGVTQTFSAKQIWTQW